MADQVPQEVWNKIFVHLKGSGDDDWQDLDEPTLWQNRSTLLPLLLTCQFFHGIVEPLLYENAVVYLDSSDTLRSTLPYALEQKEERRGWVKTLVTTWRGAQPAPDSNSRLVHSTLVLKALQLAPRLQGIHLYATIITVEMLDQILTHPTLRALIIQACSLGGTSVRPTSLIQSNITDLNLYQIDSIIPLAFTEASRLCSLPGLVHLTITSQFCSRIAASLALLPPPQLSGLRRLIIYPVKAHPSYTRGNSRCFLHLSPLLDHTPNITELHLKKNSPFEVLISPASSLPHLKILRGPVEVVQVLTSNIGELESLRVDGTINHPRMFPLGQSILSLSLDAPLEAVADLAVACPALLSLSLRLRPGNRTTKLDLSDAISVMIWVESKGPSALSRLTSLQNLSFKLTGGLRKWMPDSLVVTRNSLIGEQTVLEEYSKEMPRLNEIRLPSQRVWRTYNVREGWEVVFEPEPKPGILF